MTIIQEVTESSFSTGDSNGSAGLLPSLPWFATASSFASHSDSGWNDGTIVALRLELERCRHELAESRRSEAHLRRTVTQFLGGPRLSDQPQLDQVALGQEMDAISGFEGIVGTSPALQAVLSRAAKVAPADSTVMITGATGTGKELIARAIHHRSDRSTGPFIKVNCAAIPQSLIAAELFGHERGAFTGASQKKLGRFELAKGGTLFLDEIGELPAETQVALLRVLQEREFERLGGTQSIKADVRLIVATNRSLETEIAAGAYRSDLYYRLNVFPIEMPSLRDRKEDIPLLTAYFVRHFAAKMRKDIKGISPKTLDMFESYNWPGNIRELQNVVERSMIVCETEYFSADVDWRARPPSAETPPTFHPTKPAMDEKGLIETILVQTNGRVSGAGGAAAKLGMPASTLESKIRVLKINKHVFKQPQVAV